MNVVKERKYLFIIGAMKSGTSAIFSLLAQHPSICPCHPKEPEFFVKKNYNLSELESYKDFWNCERNEDIKYYMEASTSYTKIPIYPNVAERILDAGLDAHFIYIMRNPISRLKSQLNMAVAENYRSFERDGRIANPLIFFSQYYMQIKEYYDRFPKNRILLLRFEDFTVNPQKIMKEIFDFIDVDRNFELDYDRMNKHDGVIYKYRNHRLLLITRDSLQFLQNKYKQRKKLKMFFFFLERKLDKLVDKLDITIPKSENSKILKILQEDLKNLSEHYNLDTTIWDLHSEIKD